MLADAEHFAVSPDWKWYILAYFFLAGVAGGAYVIATLMRLAGDARDRAAARTGYLVAFPAVLVCPVLLILDLGSPARFWHMLIDTTPNRFGLNFNTGSPMSVGVWGLSIFAVFALVSFVEALAADGIGVPLGGPLLRLMAGTVGTVVSIVGAVLGLFVATYTGVLLAVSNQPVWSDTWALGGLFLVSGMSAAAVVMSTLTRLRSGATATEERLAEADGYFAAIEVLFVVLFWITLASAGRLGTILGHGWVLLWVLVLVSLLPALAGLSTRALAARGGRAGPTAAGHALRAAAPAVALLVVLGVIALRAVVIFSPQA